MGFGRAGGWKAAPSHRRPTLSAGTRRGARSGPGTLSAQPDGAPKLPYQPPTTTKSCKPTNPPGPCQLKIFVTVATPGGWHPHPPPQGPVPHVSWPLEVSTALLGGWVPTVEGALPARGLRTPLTLGGTCLSPWRAGLETRHRGARHSGFPYTCLPSDTPRGGTARTPCHHPLGAGSQQERALRAGGDTRPRQGPSRLPVYLMEKLRH